MERQIRTIETRVALELCFRGDVAAGLDSIAAQYPEIATAVELHTFRHFYQPRAAPILPRAYTLPSFLANSPT
jgi:hypothetical protein